MLSYQHVYHAGNHADVLKHTVLCCVLDYLRQKDKPFYCHDTHAGRGMYRLDSAEALKTGEHLGGISAIWQQPSVPQALETYLTLVARCNGGRRDVAPRRYPGSPLLMQSLLRPGDRLGCTELHPQEYLALRQALSGCRQAKIERQQGYEALKAVLPPRERRGVVLVDPSYEVSSDDTAVIQCVREGLQRFAQGIYLVWYPLVNAARTRDLLYRASKLVAHNLLQLELRVASPASGAGLYGSGMLVFNPPWQLDRAMEEALPWLAATLGGGEADWRVNWLHPAA